LVRFLRARQGPRAPALLQVPSVRRAFPAAPWVPWHLEHPLHPRGRSDPALWTRRPRVPWGPGVPSVREIPPDPSRLRLLALSVPQAPSVPGIRSDPHSDLSDLLVP
jgi:hypothetical protein